MRDLNSKIKLKAMGFSNKFYTLTPYVDVSASIKQFGEMFLAESVRRVLKFGRISVAESGSMQGEAAADSRILLPLPQMDSS